MSAAGGGSKVPPPQPYDAGLTPQQKTTVTNFLSFCSDANPYAARGYLQKYGWNIERATDQYWDNPQEFNHLIPKGPAVEKAKIEALFKKYAVDKDCPGEISFDCLAPLYKDIGLNNEANPVNEIIFAFYVRSPFPNQIFQEPFVQALTKHGIDSLDGLKRKSAEWMLEVKKPDAFKEFYAWSYGFFHEADDKEHKKPLAFDLCKTLWDMILPLCGWQLAPNFKTYLSKLEEKAASDPSFKINRGKAIAQDTWRLVGDFARTVPTLAQFEDDGTWCHLIEGFFTGQYNADNASEGKWCD